MAFGITRDQLITWKKSVTAGNISFLTHYWYMAERPEISTVTKVGCANIQKLLEWGASYGLKPEWLHHRSGYPHFDLIGATQFQILKKEKLWTHIEAFKLDENFH